MSRLRPQRPETVVHSLLLDAAREAPEATAVIDLATDGDGRAERTYADLLTCTEVFAEGLLEAGAGPGDRVVVDAANTASTIAMLMATSMVGAAFVPISPEVPDDRARQILQLSRPQVYAHARGAGRLERLSSGEVLGTTAFSWMHHETVGGPRPAPRDRESRTIEDLAYVVFTSGSTGVPKGVAMPQQASHAFFSATRGLLEPDDRVASTAPLQFDFCLLDIGVCIANRSAIVPIPREWLRWPRRLAEGFEHCTRVHAVPSVWRGLVRRQPQLLSRLRHLRAAMYSGEPFPADDLAVLHRALPGTRIVNCYGPTECMACSFTDISAYAGGGGDGLPLDGAYPGSRVEIVDETGKEIAADSVSGQVRFTGPSVFAGYWSDGEVRRPDTLQHHPDGSRSLLTGDYAHRDTDGRLIFDGRRDRQVKISGNRVELSEIEIILARVEGIEEARVVVIDNDGQPALVAFVAGPADPETAESACRQACLDRLPVYMHPIRILPVERLPRTANGKVDQQVLLQQSFSSHPRRPEVVS